MAERKSNRRKKIETPATLAPQREVNSEIPKEEKRKVYPTSIVTINWDSLNTKRKMNEELRTQISELYGEIQNKPSSQIDKISQLIEQYPEIQILHGYLLMAYLLDDDEEKALEVAEYLSKKYPDFMYGKIGTVESYILTGKLDSIPEFLENKFDYKELFPEKGSYHIAEVLQYYFSIGRYFALKGQVDKANEYMKEIKSFDEEHAFIKKLQKDIDKGSGVKFYQKVLRKFKKDPK